MFIKPIIISKECLKIIIIIYCSEILYFCDILIHDFCLKEYYYPYNKWKKYDEMIKKYEKEGKHEEVGNIRKELKLLNKIANSKDQISDIWKWCIENFGTPFPEWRKEDLEYYKERFNETTNTLDKARFAYVIWTFEKNPKYSTEALKNFLETGKTYIENEYYVDILYVETMCFCFQMAAEISLRLNIKQPGIIEVLKEITQAIVKLDKDNHRGVELLCLLEIFTDIAERVRKKKKIIGSKDFIDISESIINIALKSAEYWHKKLRFHLEREFFEQVRKIANVLKNNKLKKYTLIRIAKSWEEEAQHREDPMVKTVFLLYALEIYSSLGDKEKIKELINKTKQYWREAEKDFKTISNRVEIPYEYLESILDNIDSEDPVETLEKLLKCNIFLPQEENLEKNSKNNTLSSLIPRYEMDRELPRRIATQQDEIVDSIIEHFFRLESEWRNILLDYVFNELLSQEKINEKHLVNYLKNKGINGDIIALFELGLKHHLKEDYISAIHLMAPLIERILRIFLDKPVNYKIKRGGKERGFEDKLLGGLVELAEKDGLLSHEFSKYLKEIIVPIRNDVCHGWLPFDGFNRRLSTLLIYIFLKIVQEMGNESRSNITK